MASKNIDTKQWATQISNLDCLLNFLDGDIVPRITNPKIAAFHSWSNEIDNLSFLLRTTAPNSSLKENWIKRLMELSILFKKQFEDIYFVGKVSQLPPKWVAEKYKSIKKFY